MKRRGRAAGRKLRTGSGGSPAPAGQDGGVQVVLGEVGGWASGKDYRRSRRRALVQRIQFFVGVGPSVFDLARSGRGLVGAEILGTALHPREA